MGLGKKLLLGGLGLVGLVIGGGVGFVAYAHVTGEERLTFADTPMPALTAVTDPAVIARGEYIVYGPGHCHTCHGTVHDPEKAAELRTRHPLSGGYEMDMTPLAKTWAANLTPDDATGIGRRTDAELARTLRHGVLADGRLSLMMRLGAARLSDEDIVAVISYLRSSEPVSHPVERGTLGPAGGVVALLTDLGPRYEVPEHVAPGDEPSVARGRYLVEDAAVCAMCHSPFDMGTLSSGEPRLGGGTPEPAKVGEPGFEVVSPNLTSDPTGMTGRLDEDAFVQRLRAGRTVLASSMPWEDFGRMTDSDLRSIYRYLRTVPPVANDVGPTYRKVGWTPEGA